MDTPAYLHEGQLAPAALTGRDITVTVSVGGLVDQITILELKRRRLSDPAQLRNVEAELATLAPVCAGIEAQVPALRALKEELRTINAELWDVEDGIRACEARSDFGPAFIRLARAVYRTNDRRAALKRQINTLAGSRLVEEKSYGP